MCDGYSADPCPIWDESHPTARKKYVCVACHEPILPGQRYRRTATLFEGTWGIFKNCMRCAAMIDALKQRMSEYTTEIHYLHCGEVWNDPPPEIEFLAFALPGDFAEASTC